MAFAIYHKSGYAVACRFIDANDLEHNGYIGKDSDGEYTTRIYWQHPVIDGYLPDDLGFEI